jgi:phosphoglycerate kinase
LKNLVKKVDRLFVGGAMANTFLAARGHDVGASLYEVDLIDTAKAIDDAAGAAGCALLLPTDVVVAKEFKPHADRRVARWRRSPRTR